MLWKFLLWQWVQSWRLEIIKIRKGSNFNCFVLAVCKNNCVNGDCTAPDTCTCSIGWSGSTCTEGFYPLFPLPYASLDPNLPLISLYLNTCTRNGNGLHLHIAPTLELTLNDIHFSYLPLWLSSRWLRWYTWCMRLFCRVDRGCVQQAHLQSFLCSRSLCGKHSIQCECTSICSQLLVQWGMDRGRL